jgi:hypothetical protein
MADPTYTWDERAGRYRGPGGRFVAQEEVHRALNEVIDQSAKEMKAAALLFREGDLSLSEWQLLMEREIKNTHLASAAAAVGGWAQMTQSDYGRVGAEIKAQYQYLRGFVQDIQQGITLDGRFINRVGLYIEAGRATLALFEKLRNKARGMSEERNLLGVAEHCTGAGSCTEQTGLGWVPIGTLLPIGQRLCRVKCKCAIEYR